MTAPMEAARKDVQEKAADELGDVEHHGSESVAAFDPVVLPLEGDAGLIEGDEPGGRDCDTMGGRGRRERPAVRRRDLRVSRPFRRKKSWKGGWRSVWMACESGYPEGSTPSRRRPLRRRERVFP